MELSEEMGTLNKQKLLKLEQKNYQANNEAKFAISWYESFVTKEPFNSKTNLTIIINKLVIKNNNLFPRHNNMPQTQAREYKTMFSHTHRIF